MGAVVRLMPRPHPHVANLNVEGGGPLSMVTEFKIAELKAEVKAIGLVYVSTT